MDSEENLHNNCECYHHGTQCFANTELIIAIKSRLLACQTHAKATVYIIIIIYYAAVLYLQRDDYT